MTRALRWKPIALQVALLALVAGLVWLAADTALGNMRARGLASGFAFLHRPAGFDIAQTLIPYAPTDPHTRVFLVGALNTLAVAGAGIVLATLVGLIAGLGRRARSVAVRTVATGYVEAARNTPLPIQLLVWYSLVTAAPPPRAAISLGGFGYLSNRGLYLPAPVWEIPAAAAMLGLTAIAAAAIWAWFALRRRRGAVPAVAAPVAGAAAAALFLAAFVSGISLPRPEGFGFAGGFEVSPPLFTLLVALTVYTGGYIAEVVRGGLDAVGAGQSEAARALGLSDAQAFRLVALPQAWRIMAPPLVSQYLNLLKNSSLAVVVGYPDLVATFGGTSLNQTGQAIETLGLVLLFYVALSVSLSAAVNIWSRRQGRWASR
ncbi:MAG: amino acid ABC transporter permease [Phenylobacterium sp.]|uniref:amino acid ABC transporter permease n=1 Tax=Phenylobacterium sp. TaxID=1871053 RepID=UPI00391BF500